MLSNIDLANHFRSVLFYSFVYVRLLMYLTYVHLLMYISHGKRDARNGQIISKRSTRGLWLMCIINSRQPANILHIQEETNYHISKWNYVPKLHQFASARVGLTGMFIRAVGWGGSCFVKWPNINSLQNFFTSIYNSPLGLPFIIVVPRNIL